MKSAGRGVVGQREVVVRGCKTSLAAVFWMSRNTRCVTSKKRLRGGVLVRLINFKSKRDLNQYNSQQLPLSVLNEA